MPRQVQVPMSLLGRTRTKPDPDPATPVRLGRAQVTWDLVLAAVCVAVAVTVHASGVDSIPQNRAPDAWSVAFTVSAVAPLALRRRHPLPVLAACLPGVLALVAWQYAVGSASLGILIAFYTVAAWGSPSAARRGVVVVVAGVVGLLVLQPIDLSIQGALANSAVLLGGWVLGTGTRERRALHAAQVAESEQRVELERERGSRAAAEERLRITRELHDVLGHAISVMVVQAGVAEHLLDSQPDQARAALARIGQTGRSSLQEIRQLLGATRDDGDGSPRRPQPRLSDLPSLVAQVEAAGLPVQLTGTELADGGTPEGVELAAYRVVQEALTNTLKHAGPARAQVRLSRTAGAVEVEVVDDGCGPGAGGPGTGQGLTGMRERVAVYAGDLVTGQAPGGGFRVWARFSLPAARGRG